MSKRDEVKGGVTKGAMSGHDFLRYAGFLGCTLAIGATLAILLAACGVSSITSSTTSPTTSSSTTTGATTATTASVSSKTTQATSPVTTKSPSTASQNQKVAYLTFDDGPSELTPALLSTLNDNHVKATFFVIGLQAKEYPGMVKEIASYGHVIGVHSWTYDYAYIYKNTANFLADFDKMKNYIHKETGITPNISRFPGGTNNTVCFNYSEGHIMRKLVPLIEDMGFKYYDWNVSSAEASIPPPSKDTIIKTVVSQCKHKDTVVILFHDKDIQGYVDAIPKIITQLRSMGFAFDTLSPDNPPKSRSASVQFDPS